MSEILRPNSTTESGGMGRSGCSNVHECIDEVTPDTNTYIYGSSSDHWQEAWVTLDNPTEVPGSGDVIMRLRYKINPVTYTAGQIYVYLMCGDTAVAYYYKSNGDDQWHDISKTLTSEEKALITDWDDLKLKIRIYRDKSPYSNACSTPRISWVELEVPDPDPPMVGLELGCVA